MQLTKLSKNLKFFGFVAISALFSYLLIGIPFANNFPYLTFFIILTILSTLVYLFKTSRDKFSTVLYILSLFLVSFIIIRANLLLTFLNIISVIYIISILSIRKVISEELGILDAMFAPILALLSAIFARDSFSLDIADLMREKNNKVLFKTKKLIVPILLSVILLFLILPLLGFVNPLFKSYMDEIIQYFGIDLIQIIKDLFKEYVGEWIFRLLFFAGFLFMIPKWLSAINSKRDKKETENEFLEKFSLTIPKVVVAVVLMLFFVTQIRLYMSSDQILEQLEYSNSQYAREVFAQLSIVAMIVFGLLYLKEKKTKLNSILTYLLVAESLFLTGMAFKSVYDYTSNWGFTHKRLYGYAGIIWIIGIFGLYLRFFYKNLSKYVLVKGIIILSSLVMIAVNITNFDYLIYHYKKSTTHAGVDYKYLSKLSTDADYYISFIDDISEEMKDEPKLHNGLIKVFDWTYPGYWTSSGWQITYHIKRLRDGYDNLDFRIFNLSMYNQYRKIKDYDIERFENELNDFSRRIGELHTESGQTLEPVYFGGVHGVEKIAPVVINHELGVSPHEIKLENIYEDEGISPEIYRIKPQEEKIMQMQMDDKSIILE